RGVGPERPDANAGSGDADDGAGDAAVIVRAFAWASRTGRAGTWWAEPTLHMGRPRCSDRQHVSVPHCELVPVPDVEVLGQDLAEALGAAGEAAAVVAPQEPAGPAPRGPEGVGEDQAAGRAEH